MVMADPTVLKVLNSFKDGGGIRVIEQGSNEVASWRVWSNGLIEQWSIQTDKISTLTSNKTFTFPKPYSNAECTLIGVGFVVSNYGGQYGAKTTTGFTTTSQGEVSGTSGWYACGY